MTPDTTNYILAGSAGITALSVVVGLIINLVKVSAKADLTAKTLAQLFDDKGQATFVFHDACKANRVSICDTLNKEFDRFNEKIDEIKKSFNNFDQVNVASRQKVFDKLDGFHEKEGETKTMLKIMSKELEQTKTMLKIMSKELGKIKSRQK